MVEVKFRAASEVALFDVLQRYGKLPVDELSRRAKLARTTSYHGAKRLQSRGLFDYQAVPRLSQFSEVPMMVLGFGGIAASKLGPLVSTYGCYEPVRMLMHDKQSVFFFLMHQSPAQLNELSMALIHQVGQAPHLSMLSPSIVKMDLTIPVSVLQAIYPREKSG